MRNLPPKAFGHWGMLGRVEPSPAAQVGRVGSTNKGHPFWLVPPLSSLNSWVVREGGTGNGKGKRDTGQGKPISTLAGATYVGPGG